MLDSSTVADGYIRACLKDILQLSSHPEIKSVQVCFRDKEITDEQLVSKILDNQITNSNQS